MSEKTRPLFDMMGRLALYLKHNLGVLLLMIVLLLTLFVLVPVYMILLILSITVSVSISVICHYTLKSPLMTPVGLSDIEQNVLGGIISGSIGFIVGTYAGSKLKKNISWGYSYRQQQKDMQIIKDEINSQL